MQKAVYTYLTDKNNKLCGFSSINDLVSFLSLSVEYSKKHFSVVELVTDEAGKKLLIDTYKVGFTQVNTSLESIKYTLHPDLWAFAKLTSYNLQREPFIHIDNDVIIWDKLPNRILTAPLFFQNKEDFEKSPGYKGLIKEAMPTTVGRFLNTVNSKFSYNCGIVGCNDLSLIKKWYNLANGFIYNPKNASFWNSTHKVSKNFLFEQHFIACIAKSLNIDDKVQFVLNDFDYTKETNIQIKYTHFWGVSKKNTVEINKIKLRLKKEFPLIHKHIESVELEPKEVFKDILSKGGAEYKYLLTKEIKEKNIHSIVYMGYELNKSSKLIDSTGKNIEFVYCDELTKCVPECDLLILKDVIGSWSKEITYEFFKKRVPAKYILATNFILKN